MKKPGLTAQKVGLLGSLYFAQGLPFGFFTQALPVLMRRQGYSLRGIGLSSLLAAPWALKFLWAPLVDAHGSPVIGRRRSWIVPLQLLATTALAATSAAPPCRMPLLLAAVLVINLLCATQDIATDGLAVDILSPGEWGLANGLQVAGYRVGMIIGGGALLAALGLLGWRGTCLVMAAALALSTVPILGFHERLTVRCGPPHRHTFIHRPGAWRILALSSGMPPRSGCSS